MYVMYICRSDDYGQTFVSQASKLRGGFLLNPNIYRFPSDNRIVSSQLLVLCLSTHMYIIEKYYNTYVHVIFMVYCVGDIC